MIGDKFLNGLNYIEADKKRIEEEKNHNYHYYEFTEEKILNIISKSPRDLNTDEWFCLIQMIYPKNLIASGLFQPILIFEIKDGYRVDPPILAFDGIEVENKKIKNNLFSMIYQFLQDRGIVQFHSEWVNIKEKIEHK